MVNWFFCQKKRKKNLLKLSKTWKLVLKVRYPKNIRYDKLLNKFDTNKNYFSLISDKIPEKVFLSTAANGLDSDIYNKMEKLHQSVVACTEPPKWFVTKVTNSSKSPKKKNQNDLIQSLPIFFIFIWASFSQI